MQLIFPQSLMEIEIAEFIPSDVIEIASLRSLFVLRISYIVLRNTHHARRNTKIVTEEIVLRYFLTRNGERT